MTGIVTERRDENVMDKETVEGYLADMEKIRRHYLETYLQLTYQLNDFATGSPYMSNMKVTAEYCAEQPRAVKFHFEGELPPSLNAVLDFGDPEDRHLWYAIRSWWHGAIRKPFAARGGKFPYLPLRRPIIFASISAADRIYDLDNYGVKAVIDALEKVGAIEADLNVEWFVQTRVKGSPEMTLLVTEYADRLVAPLWDVYRQANQRTFELIKVTPLTTNIGNSDAAYYA